MRDYFRRQIERPSYRSNSSSIRPTPTPCSARGAQPSVPLDRPPVLPLGAAADSGFRARGGRREIECNKLNCFLTGSLDGSGNYAGIPTDGPAMPCPRRSAGTSGISGRRWGEVARGRGGGGGRVEETTDPATRWKNGTHACNPLPLVPIGMTAAAAAAAAVAYR